MNRWFALGLACVGGLLSQETLAQSVYFKDMVTNAPRATTPLGPNDVMPVIQGGQTKSIAPTEFVRSGVTFISILDTGALPDVASGTDGSIAASSRTFTSATAAFTGGDCNAGTHPSAGCTGTYDKIISIDYAGAAGAPLITTIVGVTNATTITLADAASTAVPYLFATMAQVGGVNTPGTGYVPGNTVTLTGGTATTATVLTVKATQATGTPSIVAGGSGASVDGATSGSCMVKGTTGGTGTTASQFSAKVTITAGAVTAFSKFISTGVYTTNPTDLANEPISGGIAGYEGGDDTASDPPIRPCVGLTGAIFGIQMGVLWAIPTTPGVYSAAPANPVAQGSSSGAGTGANFTMIYQTGGWYSYGTDDSAAIAAAMARVNDLAAAGTRACLYVPGGNYLLRATTLPVFSKNGCAYGDGTSNSKLILDPGYTGDVFAWSDAWIDGTDPFNGAMANYASQKWGPFVSRLTIQGDRTSPHTQNAFVFYDRADEVIIKDVEVRALKGRCLKTGTTANTSVSFSRESHIDNLTCFDVGDAGVPTVELGSAGTATANDNIDFGAINIYGPRDVGLWIHNCATGPARQLKFNGALRIEGTENNPENVQADLLKIGDTVCTGKVQNIVFNQVWLVDPYLNYSALHVVGATALSSPKLITVKSGRIAGGLPFGKGLTIDAGNTLDFWLQQINTKDTNVTVGSTTLTGAYIRFDAAGQETSLTYSIDATATQNFITVLQGKGIPGSVIPFTAGLPYTICQYGGLIATTAAAETLAASCTIPKIGRNDKILVHTEWDYPISANAKTLKVRFDTTSGVGGTLFMSFSPTAAQASSRCTTHIANANATNAQTGAGNGCNDNTGAVGAKVTSAIQTNGGASVVNITATGNGAGESVDLINYSVMVIPAP